MSFWPQCFPKNFTVYTIKKALCTRHFFDCRKQICPSRFFITKDSERQKKLVAVLLPAFFLYVSLQINKRVILIFTHFSIPCRAWNSQLFRSCAGWQPPLLHVEINTLESINRFLGSASHAAFCLGYGNSLGLTLQYVITFEFSQSAKDRQHEFSCRCAGINRFLFADKLHTFCVQCCS